MYHYSATTKGFYVEGIHTELPQDAVPVSEAEHAALMQAQAQGQSIQPDAAGRPVALPPPAPSQEALFTGLRAQRDSRIAATDYLLMPDYPISPERLAVVKTYRQALRDLPDQPGAPWDGGGDETPWPVKPEE